MNNVEFVKTGNIFDADVDALVNPVNCVGVMGAGLAKAFAQRHPEMAAAYKMACVSKYVVIGRTFTWHERSDNVRYHIIFNVATKDHWREKSVMSNVRLGVIDLRNEIQKSGVRTVAIPALGCGLGGLAWAPVEAMLLIELGYALQDVEFKFYLPQD